MSGKFDRVVGQIQDNLIQTDRIAKKLFRQIRQYIYDKFNVFCSDSGCNGIYNITDQAYRRILCFMDIDSSGFNFGKIQNVVDNR